MARDKKKKTKVKTIQKEITLTVVKEKLDLKQNLKSFAILSLLVAGAVLGRAALQGVPSVETVTPFAILAGFWLGPIYGLIAGASGFYASNFLVWGGQGPWTVFQMLGAGLAGFVAGLLGKIWKSFKWFLVAVTVGVLIFETAVNIGGALIFFGLLGIPTYFLTSLPFTAIHLVSSLIIAGIIWKGRKALPKLGAKLMAKKSLLLKETEGGLETSELTKELFKVRDGKKTLLSKVRWKKE